MRIVAFCLIAFGLLVLFGPLIALLFPLWAPAIAILIAAKLVLRLHWWLTDRAEARRNHVIEEYERLNRAEPNYRW